MDNLKIQSCITLASLIVLSLLIDSSLTAEFSYKDVNSWPQTYPQCGGQRQSPIDFNEENVNEDDVQMFSMVNYYKKPLSSKLLNEGNRLRVIPVYDESDQPFLTGGVFNSSEYVLDSVHFHWSRVSTDGSEHTFSGASAAVEMHSVHYKREYGSFENALNFSDGLSTIGGLFFLLNDYSTFRRRRQASEFIDDEVEWEPSPALGLIVDSLQSVATPGSSVDIEPLAMSDFRPIQVDENVYVSYVGSMTSPPCVENVLWLISAYPYDVTSEQLEILQSTVEFDHGDDHNNRPPQPRNGRKITGLLGVWISTD